MTDWRAYVREHLPPLDLEPTQEAAIVDELASQLQDVYDTALRAGATPDDARRRACDEVGDWADLARALLDARAPVAARAQPIVSAGARALDTHRLGRPLRALLGDLRLALRTALARPLFACTTILVFAIGIGATTVAFSIVRSVLLAPLPYPDAHRLLFVREVVPEVARHYPVVGVNARSYLRWQTSCRSTCDGMAALALDRSTLTGHGAPEGLSGVRVSPQLFGLLGTSPLHGRLLTEAETVDGQDSTVVLSHGLWRRRFGADPAIVGRTIRLSERPVVVVGVLPAAFRFPQLTHYALSRTDWSEPEYFRPLAWSDRAKTSWGEFDNFVVVRAARSASLESVREELTVLTRTEFAPASIHPFPIMEPLSAAITSEARRPLWMLLGAVATTLLIACVNVSTLLGSRWLGRQREIAIRCALGAGRIRLVSLVAAESLLLAGIGGIISAVAARFALGAIMAWVPGNIPRLADVRIDVAALAFAAALTTLCALVCTVLPAWHTVSADPDDALRDGSRSATDGRRAGMVRSWLVGAEVVLTTMLLVVSGLLLTSFVNVLRVDPGFRTSSLLAADLLLPSARYGTPEARVQFHDRLLGDLQQVPGFQSAGTTARAPLDGNASVDSIIAVGDSRPDSEHPVSTHVQVSHGFFDTIGVPLLHGRLPVTSDRQRRVAVISERTARAVWGEPAMAVGRSYSRGRRDVTWEVIGVVGDTRQWGLEQEVGLVTYVPYRVGDADAQLSVVVRTGPSLPVATAFERLRHVVRAIDAELPVQRPRTFDDVVDGALAPRRFQLTLVAAFATGGLLLACIGIYGVSAASVERRHHELTIRLALGATPRTVRRLVVRQGLTPVVAGLVLGLVLGVLVARGLASLFFGVTSTPPLVLAMTIGVVLAVALLACIGPASRAARIRLAGALRGV